MATSPPSSPMRTIKLVIIHHSASPRSTTLGDIDKWHRAKGYKDCGYHFVVEDDGAVLKGRDVGRQGAHCKGANRDSIGVCVTGNNTIEADRWNDEQIESLMVLLSQLLERFGPMPIMGHRDVPGASTLCPGLDVGRLIMERTNAVRQ